MPIDSTADLLFRIGANSDDAEANIQRFRTVLSKDLSDISGEFGDWATKTFGALNTLQGTLTAGAAAMAAGAVAAGAAAIHMADQYAEYVESVASASKVTGIGVEDMSRLKHAAEMTGTNFDALSGGLARFTSNVVKGAQGSKQQLEAFERLGITQKDLQAGEHNLLPLLEQVQQGFAGLKNKTDQTAESRDLFGKAGTEFLNFLRLGKDGLKQMADEADRLGVVITEEDVKALHEYKAALAEQKAVQESVDMQVGRQTLPLMTYLRLSWAALFQTVRQGVGDPQTFFMRWGANVDILKGQVDALAESLAKMGKQDLQPPPEAPPAAKAKEDWEGLTEVLHRVRDATLDTASVDERLRKEYGDLTEALDKAAKKFAELKAAGTLKPEDAAAQAAALAAMPAALSALIGRYIQEIGKKNLDAGRELQEEELRQGEQTMAAKVALLDIERQKRLEKLRAEKADTAENLAEEERLYQQGMARIANEAGSALSKAEQTLSAKIAALGAQTLEQKKEQFNQAVDADFAALSKDLQENKNIQDLIVAYRKAGLAKIDTDAKAAGDTEIARAREQLERIESERQTHEQRIEAQYQADVAKFTAAEERKALAVAIGEAQRAQIVAAFAAIRKGLYDKEQADLQQLQNSQGWQAVFGAKFAEAIRGNEALAKEWATSQQQAHMMVRVSLESLKESGQQAFGQMADGMGSAIAQSLVYSKSLGDAMRAALAQTLESISARAMVQAIYSSALGFLCLAEQDYSGAASAFEAAAIFGSVGLAAGVAGRAAAGSQSAASGAGRGGSGSGPGVGQYGSQTAARQADQQGVAAPGAGPGGPHVTLNVQGHLVGWTNISELTGAISDAVMNSNVQLTATNTKTGRQITQ